MGWGEGFKPSAARAGSGLQGRGWAEERKGRGASLGGRLSQLGEQPRGLRLLWELLQLPGRPKPFSHHHLSPPLTPCYSLEDCPWVLRSVFPACIRLQPGGALPHAGAPGASRTPSPLRPLSALCSAAIAPPPPPPSLTPALGDATQPRPALAAGGHARKWGATADPALGRGKRVKRQVVYYRGVGLTHPDACDFYLSPP